MDFNWFKSKVSDFASKTKQKISSKFDETKHYIKTEKDLKEFIKKSKNTSFKSEKTWETKKFTKHVIVVFIWKENNLGFKLKILKTKAWSSNVALKIAQLPLKDVKTPYKVTKFPSLVLFTNQKYSTTIVWKEKIEKLAKNMKLDIIEQIEESK